MIYDENVKIEVAFSVEKGGSRIVRGVGVGLLTFVLAACAFNPLQPFAHRREQAYVHQHPHTAFRAAIESGTIMRGMSKAEVVAAWGSPCGYCYGTASSSWGSTWEYNVFGSATMGAGTGTIVYFSPGGRVTGWSQ